MNLHDQRLVLDKGMIQLVDYMGSDKRIVDSARISFSADRRSEIEHHKDERLIHYLMFHGHSTPFESCYVTFMVKAPIFVYRQWHRHRTQSYNEESARYIEMIEEFYVPEIENIGVQSSISKQARDITEIDTDSKEYRRRQEELHFYTQHCHEAFKLYKEHLEKGWPKELARACLPVSTYSRMTASANLLNWYRFLGERLHPHAQWEIRQYAEEIMSVLMSLYPWATQSFKDYWLDKKEYKYG